MENYRETAPESYKELTSNGIMNYFEDERASKEDKKWLKDILTSEDYRLPEGNISKYNWRKIKKEFCKKYFPEIAPEERTVKLTMEERINAFLAD